MSNEQAQQQAPAAGGEVDADRSLTQAAAGLAAAAVVVCLVLAAVDHDGPGWMLQPLFGAAAAVTAWRAGGRSPRNPVAFVALIVGVIAVAVFVGFVVAGG